MRNFDQGYNMGPQTLRPEEMAACTNCKCTWFEQFHVQQYKANHSSVLGQTVPEASPQRIVVLRCIKCKELHQPNVLITTQDRETKGYYDFLDQLEAKLEPKAQFDVPVIEPIT